MSHRGIDETDYRGVAAPQGRIGGVLCLIARMAYSLGDGSVGGTFVV